jgi:hypothetical protein
MDGHHAGTRARIVKKSRPAHGDGVMETTGHIYDPVVRFLKSGGFWWSAGISIAAAVASFAVAGFIVVRWPADRFKGEGPTGSGRERHPIVRALAILGKNAAGVVLVLLGLVMSIPGVPGQGLLTVLIGLTLLNFPGKRRLERRLLRIHAVLHAINRLRARFARPPLELD